METYLLLARSVTHAQQMMRILERGGIYTKVQRAGGTLTQKGCGYSLRVQAKNYAAAMERLRAAGEKPVKVLLERNGERIELS